MPLISKVKDIFQRASSAKKKKTYHNVLLDNPEENWTIIGDLGDGAYGKVYKARHKITGAYAALKQLELEGEDDLESFMIEIDILSECKHSNVVELIEAYHYDGKLWMYLEYCDGGALDSIMVDLDRPLNENQIAYICKELCKALIYIHSQKVIHRDLKAGNVLLTMSGGVKLADFGVSAKNKNTMDKRGTFIGTPYWLAPEVILCETFIDAKYDYKADIWSLGISLIEFAQMDPPHHEISPVRVMLKIQKSEPPKLIHPSRWSKEFNDFIGKCLIKDPTHRPDAEELLKHPFINRDIPLKPLKDLILEYNAEVEEVVEEEPDEQDHSRGSIVSELMTNIDNLDKDASVKSSSHKLPSPTEEAPVSTERKVSKGPAPLPPKVNSTPQSSPLKKGPAPAAPSQPSTVVTTPTSTTPESHTPSVDKNTPLVSAAIVSAGSLPISLSSKTESAPSVVPKEESDTSKGKTLSSSQAQDTHTTTDVNHIPDSLPNKISSEKGNDIIIESPSKKSKLESDINNGASTADALNITVNSVDVTPATPVSDDSSKTVSLFGEQGQQSIPESNQIIDVTEQQSSPSENRTLVPVMVSPDPNSSEGNLHAPNSTAASSDVLLTSISSEGTVIVRTPTPTSGGSTEISQHSPPNKQESIVTFTVAEEPSSDELQSPLTPSGDNTDPKTAPPESPTTDISKPNSPDLLESIPSMVSPTQTLSISEAEAQAVLILENAINSAIDTSEHKTFDDDSCFDSSLPTSPTSLPEQSFEELKSTKGEVVVVASESELVELDLDTIGRRLDESEVVISNSSILQDVDDNKSPNFEVKQELEDVPDQKAELPSHDASHISVVSIDETEKSEFNRQVSLTIEGTTVGATDVDDDLESQNIICQISTNTSNDSGIAKDSSLHSNLNDKKSYEAKDKSPSDSEIMGPPAKPSTNGVQRQSSRCSDRSDVDTISTISSDKENRHRLDDSDFGDDVILRNNSLKKSRASPEVTKKNSSKSAKEKELQESIALRKKTRKRTRRFEIDGVLVTTTTSKVIYGDEDEDAIFTSAHLARKQELREIKILQKQEQKQFQDLSAKAEIAKLEQERRFENEKINLTRNYDSQIENLNRQQKQQVEKAEVKQESELKIASKKIRSEQERELKAFRESLKQELKLLKHEVDLLPKDKRKENFKVRKEKLEHDQADREKSFLEKLNDNHEMSLKRLNDEHRQHIALKERQFLEEKHQLMRARENALWEMEERHLHDRHQLAKEQLKDVYFLQRHQMLIRHNKELEQVRRVNSQKEEALIKRQQIERRQLPKRIRQEMKTREKMFREKIRISMTTLPSQEDEKEQLRKFQELEKIKYDAERKRAEKKHAKQMEELKAAIEYAIKELEILQNEKGKVLMEHETYKLKLLDEDYHKELREWKANLVPRKHKLEEAFEKQLSEQEKFYGDYLNRSISATPSQSSSSLARAT